jgi:hypothetical protein
VIRAIYYTMLITHILLAISIAYLVPRTFYLALSGQIERHRAPASGFVDSELWFSVRPAACAFDLSKRVCRQKLRLGTPPSESLALGKYVSVAVR